SFHLPLIAVLGNLLGERQRHEWMDWVWCEPRLIDASDAGLLSRQKAGMTFRTLTERADQSDSGDPYFVVLVVRGHQAGSVDRAKHTFWPPNPNEFDSTVVTAASRRTLATTSRGISGSPMS